MWKSMKNHLKKEIKPADDLVPMHFKSSHVQSVVKDMKKLNHELFRWDGNLW